MKTIILCLVAIVAITGTTFAQKSKGNSQGPHAATILHTKYVCSMHPEVTSSKPGKCPKCGMDLTLSKKEQMKSEVTKSYTCPMHSEVVSTHPGNCPKCNSKLVVDRKGSKQGVTVYSCSMHPDVKADKAGNCPICGMKLNPVKAKVKS